MPSGVDEGRGIFVFPETSVAVDATGHDVHDGDVGGGESGLVDGWEAGDVEQDQNDETECDGGSINSECVQHSNKLAS